MSHFVEAGLDLSSAFGTLPLEPWVVGLHVVRQYIDRVSRLVYLQTSVKGVRRIAYGIALQIYYYMKDYMHFARQSNAGNTPSYLFNLFLSVMETGLMDTPVSTGDANSCMDLMEEYFQNLCDGVPINI
jgi:hypothetical protein